MEVVPQLPGVGEGLDNTVHEASVAQVHQPCEAWQAHLLVLLFLFLLYTFTADRAVSHWWNHACRLGLKGKGFLVVKEDGLSSAAKLPGRASSPS